MDGFGHRHQHDALSGRRETEPFGDGERSSSQDWEEGQQSHGDADSRSQCSQKSDLGYHSMSSMRSVGSVGSHGSGDRGFGGHHLSMHRPLPIPPTAAHLMNGETQFPPSMYRQEYPDAAKSDAATVCSGSVVEDIEEESLMSCDAGSQHLGSVLMSATSHPSPPSSAS